MTENKRFTINDCRVLSDEQVLKILNQLTEENEQLKIRFKEERNTATKLASECDNLTIKNQKLELEIIRLETIIKTGEKKDEHLGWKRVDVE